MWICSADDDIPECSAESGNVDKGFKQESSTILCLRSRVLRNSTCKLMQIMNNTTETIVIFINRNEDVGFFWSIFLLK